jgi:nickel/cobalt transporter (NicO) family protein
MSSAAPALIAAAAGVGFGHAILPDHWLPLAVVGRTRRYPIATVARLSGLAGLAHVLVSLLLGALIVAVGLQFRATVEHAQNVVVGGVLFLTGVGFAAFELCGRGHSHDHAHHAEDAPAHDGHGEHAHGHRHAEPDRGRLHGLAAIMVPFGAAASPDLTILPVFLAATTAGAGAAVGSLLAFAVVTIATVMGLTLAAAFGGYRVRGQWLERWGNAITAGVLLVIGALVLVGAL